MGRLLWTCCPKGHPLHPGNCEWHYATLYPYKRCKRCRSARNKLSYQRRKANLEWINQSFSARRTDADNGLITPKAVLRVGDDKQMPACRVVA